MNNDLFCSTFHSFFFFHTRSVTHGIHHQRLGYRRTSKQWKKKWLSVEMLPHVWLPVNSPICYKWLSLLVQSELIQVSPSLIHPPPTTTFFIHEVLYLTPPPPPPKIVLLMAVEVRIIRIDTKKSSWRHLSPISAVFFAEVGIFYDVFTAKQFLNQLRWFEKVYPSLESYW